ncbi:MAG: RidA family protein [Phenylobacterium sp.]|uniref:RidA family protein n=1 Tax=Phenylobacterium sp. TaxID=1871053 RepID=UPI00120562E7|nr:RidA family protein [Phenylobacterium sp.]TAJ71970.1 MAG: RidA family protein [Phenylobacterium sp.]
MRHRTFERQARSYSQACLVEAPRRWLFVSGQTPTDAEGAAPEAFEDQCRLAWGNVERQLAAAGMGLDDLVKVTVFLADRRYREANYTIRHEVLAGRSPALTVIVCEIYDPAWLVEIEAVAAD